MARRDFSGTLAFCASLVMHALIVVVMLWAYVAEMDRRERALGTPGRWTAEAERSAKRDGEFGESGGKGEAINSLDFGELFAGRLGPQDQAPLSRDPVGDLGDGGRESVLKEAVSVPAVPESMKVPETAVAPFGVGLGEAAPVVKIKAPAQAVVVAQPASAANGTSGLAGDRAPMSESESDAFSRRGLIAVRNGKVEARLGRDFKSVRPRLSLKAEWDALSVQRPVVEMKVSIDEKGKVIDVKILRSSGSNEIDLPTTTAMYQWWIEPAKDKEGRAVKDVILVTFSYL